jgi:hypothetical protein
VLFVGELFLRIGSVETPKGVDLTSSWPGRSTRLGRSLIDLLDTIQALEHYGIDLYLDQQSIDTTTPAGRLMFQITGAVPSSNAA